MANKKIIGFENIADADNLKNKLFVAGATDSGRLFNFSYEVFKNLISEIIEAQNRSVLVTHNVNEEQITGNLVTLDLAGGTTVNINRNFFVFINTTKAPNSGFTINVGENKIVINNEQMPYAVTAGDFIEIYYTRN